MKYILFDTNVICAYYLPHSSRSKAVRDRAKMIFDAKRSDGEELFFYLPNFCVAETFSVFMKHSFGGWNRHVDKKIDTRVYKSLVNQFQDDIHNAKLIYHYELSRYHVLGVNMVAPVDHHFQFSRGGRSRGRPPTPMGTFDQLVISMGIQLTKIHGANNVAIVSADKRLIDILNKCRSPIPAPTVKKLRLDKCEEIVGIPFEPEAFPLGLNLETSTGTELARFFGKWPLDVGAVPKHYRHVV